MLIPLKFCRQKIRKILSNKNQFSLSLLAKNSRLFKLYNIWLILFLTASITPPPTCKAVHWLGLFWCWRPCMLSNIALSVLCGCGAILSKQCTSFTGSEVIHGVLLRSYTFQNWFSCFKPMATFSKYLTIPWIWKITATYFLQPPRVMIFIICTVWHY